MKQVLRSPKVSIIIPAFNEEKCIAKCLASLSKLHLKSQIEIILVDNNSSDKTVKIAKRYLTKMRLRIVKEKTKGRGAARAKGFSVAKGKILFSTDADTILPADWIENILPHFQNPEVVAVTGNATLHSCSDKTTEVLDFCFPKMMEIYRFVSGHYWLNGFNFAIRRDVYKKVGGFNPLINGAEDFELSSRVKRAGKICFHEDCVVNVSGRRFEKGLFWGATDYLKTLGVFLFNKEKAVLPDIR
jgi:biofilm PGA synthesis N-glycosyltransferase PgaC